MNRRIRQLAAAFIVLYVVLFAALNYWQVGRESELNAMGGNTRAIRREFSRPRGEIVSAEGVVAARSIPLPDDNEFPYQREYPTGELFANVTGYYSLALGATQLERTQNAVLTGQTAEQRIGNLEDIVTGGEGTGDVHMTLRADLQETAREALAGRRGSVVMLDVQTGAVLAMYSNPTYDPNRIVDPDFDAARVALEELLEAPGNPLLANAYQERYMPGSTFKVLTTGIALESGVVSLDSQFDRVTEWTPPQTSNPIQNYDGSNCGGDLREVFRRSCNIPFAQTALNVGIPGFFSGVPAWGVG
jgi:peptidoglycan glycosyltransferase